MLQAVFWKSGEVLLPNNIRLRVNYPCLLIVKFKENNLEVSISSPKQKEYTINIEINMKIRGEKVNWNSEKKTSIIRIDLPEKEQAGKSVIKRYNL